MNLWQVWLTLSRTRNRSLSVEGVSTVSVVADSNGDRVGSHLVADLSRGLNDSLDNRGVSHSTNGGKGMDSRGISHRGSGVWEGTKNHSGVSLSVPLDDAMGKGKSVTKTMVAKTSVTHSGNSGGMDQRGVDHRAHRGVVDQRGGGGEDSGASSNDGGVSLSLPLAIVKSVAIAVVAQSVAVVAKTVASVEEVGVSLCLGFRLSSSDGRESENYELEGERELRKCEREKKCILCLVKERGSVF